MKKVLVANRGEIAVRIIRACHDLGLQTVAVYSKADKDSLHVLHADEAVCIGEAPSAQSYLNIPHIISACEITGADAIHPGYGFLSENAKFADICESSGICFIGPSAKTIQLLGDKALAKQIARKVRCPVIEGSNGTIEDVEEALSFAKKLGFPIFIKATAGGGGRGIRVANDASSFVQNFRSAQREALSAFGNGSLYLEKMVCDPRHIEIQVLADKYGNAIYLGERDCTIQRRRQKLIEEAPSPVLTPSLRKKMGEAAVAIVKQANYHTAGTVEFLMDSNKNFYFMEVNTRIQVEHTITEELTHTDLVREQILLAQGEKLSFKQSDISYDGHVMQFRINAEDPLNAFSPSPGVLEYFVPSGGKNVRVDTACYSGYKISPYYDSMIAKLIVRGRNREDAFMLANRALREFHVGGVKTTIPFHKHMLKDQAFQKGEYTINYIDGLITSGMDFSGE